MADQPPRQAHMPAPPNASYSQQENQAFEAWMAARVASEAAATILPYLRTGMRVLDVGCGPGSITLGLAEAVTPGEVFGIDIQAQQVERARTLATARGVSNVRFEVGDIQTLPFEDGSFDAAFAHAVLMHLREPVQALAEIHRVLRPGGIIAIRDPDWGGSLVTPSSPLLEQWQVLRVRVRQHNGGDPFLGRHHRRLLLEAGFARAEASASVESAGSPPATRARAAWFKDQLRGFARTALTEAWIDRATVDAMSAELDAWAERPDAFTAGLWCEAIGWRGD